MPSECALNGQHTSEVYAAECPVLGRNRAERLARFRGDLSPSGEAPAIPLQGAPKVPSTGLDISQGSNTVFRDGRADKSGRPQASRTEQLLKARERARAYRARRKAAQ